MDAQPGRRRQELAPAQVVRQRPVVVLAVDVEEVDRLGPGRPQLGAPGLPQLDPAGHPGALEVGRRTCPGWPARRTSRRRRTGRSPPPGRAGRPRPAPPSSGPGGCRSRRSGRRAAPRRASSPQHPACSRVSQPPMSRAWAKTASKSASSRARTGGRRLSAGTAGPYGSPARAAGPRVGRHAHIAVRRGVGCSACPYLTVCRGRRGRGRRHRRWRCCLAGCANTSTPLSGRAAGGAGHRRQRQDERLRLRSAPARSTAPSTRSSCRSSWNGTLLLYSHGYRFAAPAPPDFDPVETNAQVSSTDSDGTGSDPVSAKLLASRLRAGRLVLQVQRLGGRPTA